MVAAFSSKNSSLSQEAMVLAIGLLLDDAIVVVGNVERVVKKCISGLSNSTGFDFQLFDCNGVGHNALDKRATNCKIPSWWG